MLNFAQSYRECEKNHSKSIYAGNPSHTSSISIRTETPLRDVSNQGTRGGQQSGERLNTENSKVRKGLGTLEDTREPKMSSKEYEQFLRRNPQANKFKQLQETMRLLETDRARQSQHRQKLSEQQPQQSRFKTDFAEEEETKFIEVPKEELIILVQRIIEMQETNKLMHKEIELYRSELTKDTNKPHSVLLGML